MTFPELDVGARGESAVSPTTANNSTATMATANSRYPSIAPSASVHMSQSLQNQPTQINGVLTSNLAPGLGQGKIYEPRIYGFRVAERAKSGPRMKWLRMKPTDVSELDESMAYHATHAGGFEGGEADGDTEMGMESQQTAIGRRKKAPIRRRRQVSSNNPDLMNTNGMGEAG